MKEVRILTVTLFLSVIAVTGSGCSDKFLDPTQIGRFRPVPAVNVILDSLGVAEETPSAWANAEEPKPVDVMVFETDYVFGPGDTVRITIYELFREGTPFANDYMINETGKISIPDVGIIEATGLTESQLEDEIKQILSPSILKEPSITVTLVGSQRRTFTILGNGVPQPNRYGIPRYNFRLNDAIATAQVSTQFNVSNIYVVRQVTGQEALTEPDERKIDPKLFVPDDEMLEIITPRAQRQLQTYDNRLVITSSEMVSEEELSELASPEGFERPGESTVQGNTTKQWVFKDGKWVQVELEQPQKKTTETKNLPEPSDRETIEQPLIDDQLGRIEWIFRDGKWIPVRNGETGAAKRLEKIGPEKLKKTRPEMKDIGLEQLEWDLQVMAGGLGT